MWQLQALGTGRSPWPAPTARRMWQPRPSRSQALLPGLLEGFSASLDYGPALASRVVSTACSRWLTPVQAATTSWADTGGVSESSKQVQGNLKWATYLPLFKPPFLLWQKVSLCFVFELGPGSICLLVTKNTCFHQLFFFLNHASQACITRSCKYLKICTVTVRWCESIFTCNFCHIFLCIPSGLHVYIGHCEI